MAGSDTLITNSTQLKALLHHDIRVPVDFGKDIFATVSYRSLLRLLTAGHGIAFSSSSGHRTFSTPGPPQR